MLLVQVDLNNYPIEACSKSQLILHLIHIIAQSINFNLNVAFWIKILQNWSFNKG